jgi:glycerophosphoryl diester phosphodiesterase
VVVHDARVRGRAVARLTCDELQVRSKEGQAPATLESALAVVAGRIAVDLELKEDGYVEQVMEVVAARLTPEQYVVSSFRDAVLPTVRHCVADARTGLLISPQRRVGDLERRVGKAQVDFLAPHASLTRTGLLTWAAARGLPSWVWTVNDPRALAGLLADARVEAVVTDRPQRALDISRSRAL